MECKEFARLEESFVDVRKQRLEHTAKGTLTPYIEDRLSRAELNALFALIDHRDEHGCQRKQGPAAPSKLPASRNMGGIIGPY